MNLLPINGRIVIVDNNINQALPLMKEFGKLRLSYSYYDGSLDGLPEEGIDEDVRLVFLDINLIDDAVHPVKQLYSKVFGVMNKLIGTNTFPYMLVCWSRNNTEYEDIIKLLSEELGTRRPICSIPLNKLDFFTMTGEPTDDFEDKIQDLYKNISERLQQHASFCNILKWENHIHKAANKALQEGLACIAGKDWDATANWIFTKWGRAYSGKSFEQLTNKEKLISSFHTLNLFLHETMEEHIGLEDDETASFITDVEDKDVKLTHFNERLIFSYCQTHPNEPGRIVITPEEFSDFKDSLNFSFLPSDNLIPSEKLAEFEACQNPKREKGKYFSSIRQEIRKNWDIFKLVINAPCDYAQNKVKLSRAIPGYFIKSEYRKWFNNNSDALFISPDFYYRKKEDDYFFILDFRYLTSEKEDKGNSNLRLKQVVLAEVLSKLSRHINRQGLLTIE